MPALRISGRCAMADETKNQQQGGQTNYGSQQGQGHKDQGQHNQVEQSGQSGQKNDPNKKNPSTGGNETNEQDDQNRDRQRRAS